MAKELECEDSAAPLDEALRKVVKPAPTNANKKRNAIRQDGVFRRLGGRSSL